jgi:ribose transport system ATP-binding protein
MTGSPHEASPPVDPAAPAGALAASSPTAAAANGAPAAGGIALKCSHITKRYPGVVALDDVSLEVRAGEVHGMVGENGAGKSTLMAIAAGATVPDEGEVYIDGKLLDRPSPDLARQLGLAIVYQEPALMPDLTIAENLAIGTSKNRRPGWWSTSEWARQAMADWTQGDRKIDPTLAVRDLGPDIRFIVEISKALAQEPKVLLLDEPTEHLAADDVEILFKQVRKLAAAGTAVVYISHRIPEVQRISDRISVLRDGVFQGTFEASAISQEQIVTTIVGRALDTEFPPKRSAAEPLGEPVLAVSGLRSDRFRDFHLTIHPGEIIGLAGVDGNGQTEVIRALAGMIPAKGDVKVGDRSVRLGNNASASDAGVAFIPSDRHREGMMSILGVRENVAVGNLKEYSQGGFMNTRKERAAVADRLTALAVKTPTLDTRIESLSGGNQQKVVLGRALERKPKVILADEPTQGVDVGARLEIFRFLRKAVNDGAGALIVASDGAELEGLCDRTLVLSRGQVVSELAGDDVTEQKMTEAALTSTTSRASDVTVRSQSRVRRFLRGDLAPPAIVAAATIGLAAYTATQSSFFLTGAAFTGILTLFAALAFASMAQQVVMISGGIDLSVGPLMGFLVVIASFVIVPGKSQSLLVVGWLLLVAIALTVGLVNWFPTLLKVPPFLTTLVTYTALQGLSLLFRKTVGGEINVDVLTSLGKKIGWFPWVAVVAIVLGLALEYALRRSTWGVKLRAVGSSPEHAHAVGIKVGRIQLSAYLVGGLLVFLASLVLMTQVGAGDPTAGITYTLTSITAVVIGGASIFGGRGAFVGALVGAALIEQINTSVSFLAVNTAWQTYLLGLLILVAAGAYSRARAIRAAD